LYSRPESGLNVSDLIDHSSVVKEWRFLGHWEVSILDEGFHQDYAIMTTFFEVSD